MAARKGKASKSQKSPKSGDKKPAARKKPTAKSKLTPKQQAFTEQYLANGGNGVQAARAAGYSGNDHTLRQVAHENLTKPDISSRVRERIEGMEASADEVLNLLGDHLRADFGDFDDECWNEDGSINFKVAKQRGLSRLIKKLKRETRYAVGAKGKPERIIKVEVELHDSQSAAGMIGKHHGLFQAPRKNDDDVAREREVFAQVNDQIAELRKAGWSQEEARQIVIDALPIASKWLQ